MTKKNDGINIRMMNHRERKRFLPTLLKRWRTTELNQKDSAHAGKTRRGRKKGDVGRNGRLPRTHQIFPYPKRGKHIFDKAQA